MTVSLPVIEYKTILTATGGFLDGFTHTINVAQGCAFAGSLCGLYCYAQHNRWVTNGRSTATRQMSATPTAVTTTP